MDWVNPIIKINNKFKFQLFGKTYDNLLPLYANYLRFDPNNQQGLTQHAFNQFLNSGGVFLTTQEIRTIKDTFPHSKGINYRQFIQNVRNDITQKRLAVIDHVFDLLNEQGNISLNNLFNKLNPNQHPHVRSLMKASEKAKSDMENGFKYFSRNGTTLSYEQFLEYYKDANAVIPLQRQQFFVDLLIHTFSLHNKGVTYDRLLQLEVDIYQRVRQRTLIKKNEGLKSTNSFRFIDLQQKNIVDYKLFVSVLDKLGCKYTDKQNKAIFYKHSKGKEVLSYQQLCGLFYHMGSGNKDNTNPIFQLAKSGQGSITTHGMTLRLS